MKFIKCIKSSGFQTSGNWYKLLNDIDAKQLEVEAIWGGPTYIVNSIRFDLTDIRNEITVPKQEEYKMKEFQNEQHKQLHNALIGAGFVECDGDKSPNETIRWCGYGYINHSLDEYLYFDNCHDDDVFIRNISNGETTECHRKPVSNIITYYESLGQTQLITKDNIAEVLKFNNITDISVHANSLGKKHCFSLSMKPDNWLDTLEALVGKLKPLPKIPEFNFEQYLLDNGFKKEKSNHGILLKYSVFVTIFKSASITGNYWTCQGEYIQETPQNADILITMAKLAKDLK